MAKRLPPVRLPREANLTKVRSTFRRSVRLARLAARMAKECPAEGTKIRRTERTLGAWAQSRKVALVRAVVAKAPKRTLSGLARRYFKVLRAWQVYYFGKVER